MKNLEFRRQYLLSSVDISREQWKHLTIEGITRKLYLIYHPDLEVTCVRLNNKIMVLMGYILDPLQPTLSNLQIVESLIHQNSLDAIFGIVEYLNGRFAILFIEGEREIMFHDATGFRQVFYSFQKGQTWCGSTPDIIREYTHSDPEVDDKMMHFMNSPEYKRTGFWIGHRTPIQDIFHLPPNFYLDMQRKNTIRYWPFSERHSVNLEEGARQMASLLRGTMIALSHRYELHQSLTCGWDTRLLLAASKDVFTKTHFFIHKGPHMNDKSTDIVVSLKLAEKYGLNLEVVDLDPIIVDDKFREMYYRNSVFASDRHMKVFYYAHKRKYDDTCWVTGTFGNQLLRIMFPIPPNRISANNIAKKFHYNNSPFATDTINEWLREASPLISKTGYNLTNLFYWEMFTANCQNNGATEGDIVREEARPFNCRKFISTYQSLSDWHRYIDYPHGHMKMIGMLWKDLLKIPIGSYTEKPQYWIKKAFRFLGVEIPLDKVYNFYKNKLIYNEAPKVL